ncbi:hypothetical protein, partial [Paenibacillus fonticola]|uniref:hypothetical protein n=1 Tax=Paenibacillus fonticola TaxID=379896 RepID=UPI001969B0A4
MRPPSDAAGRTQSRAGARVSLLGRIQTLHRESFFASRGMRTPIGVRRSETAKRCGRTNAKPYSFIRVNIDQRTSVLFRL